MKHAIAVIPGDGIGKEVTPCGVAALAAAAELHGGFQFEFTTYPWGCEYYQQTGEMMAPDGMERLADSEAIFLGAVGMPAVVPDHVSLWGLLIKIRRGFQQYINLRPAKQMRGVKSPLREPRNFDLVVVRENSEGEYSPIGGVMQSGNDEIAVQNAVFTKSGSERAMRFAFELARTRPQKSVVSATKSNGIVHSMPFWDRVFREVAASYPDIAHRQVHIDALSAFMVTRPETLDVVVASNLFGDILTDLGAAIMGSIGIAPSANINPERKFPSMFEPVHGSAPDIAGRGIANPVGQMWSAKMLLDFLGYHDVAGALLEAVEDTLEAGIVTPDLGGSARTEEVCDAVLARLRSK
ncbi:MAG: tartrate dehydrogenase [Alicyclobacillus sp.]|nr:tartrate dehydrogenase [Alicyclobacillus sp.]